jgi:ParB family transcriptional regulator, chromosome partitioning protein
MLHRYAPAHAPAAFSGKNAPPTSRRAMTLTPQASAPARPPAYRIADNARMVTRKPKGLGLGLEALLGPRVKDDAGTPNGASAPRALKLVQLQPGRYQPRTRMDEASLQDLAQSIRSQGLMQPILVRPLTADRYEIIAGERRARAAKIAGLDEVPVLVKEVPDEAAAAMSLIENIQREDLNPLEEAQGLKRLTTDFGMTHEQAAQAVGRSRSAASNLLRLLNLAEPVQQLLLAGQLEMGHARALLPLDPTQQVLGAQQIVARGFSVRQAEKLASRRAVAGAAARAPRLQKTKPAALVRIEQTLSDALLASVEIRVKRKTSRGEQGEVAIQFGSLDELNGLLEKLGLPAC